MGCQVVACNVRARASKRLQWLQWQLEDSGGNCEDEQPVAKSSEPAVVTATAVATAEMWTTSEQAVAAVAANDLAVAMASDCSGSNDKQSAATASQQHSLNGTQIACGRCKALGWGPPGMARDCAGARTVGHAGVLCARQQTCAMHHCSRCGA